MSEQSPREAAIDVIVRTGGRPAALLERAISSLARQSAGAIRLVLVRHGSADADALRAQIGGALREMVVIDAPGANRGRAMTAGLAQVSAPRFAFLDDDDYLLEDHFRHLLEAAGSVTAPAFAYCDILVQDERAIAGAGLHRFRDGPAQPPLGGITDRISVHSFLADRTALVGLPYDRWHLATAEDALLVASLLARSTPVHAPFATCVYVQGRSDASAYLSHPERAADELSFAREIAPVRAAVEAKFGEAQIVDEASYLAPFIAAARHAALFADLRTRAGGSGLVAVRHGSVAVAVGDDQSLATMNAPLSFEAMAGAVHLTADEVEIAAGEDYAYAARAAQDLPSPVRPAIVAIRVTHCEGTFGLALISADGALVTEACVESAPMVLEVQLPWDRAEAPSLIVRRLNTLGDERPHLRIDALTLGFPAAALVPGGDPQAAQAALAALIDAPRVIHLAAMAAQFEGKAEAIQGEPIEIDLGAAPWAYAFSTALPQAAARAGLRIDLGPSASPVFVLRVDEAWSAVGERLEVPAGSRPASLYLEPIATPVARLVIQAGAAPASARVTLNAIFLYPGA